MDSEDARALLKLPPGASEMAVQERWRELAKAHHPDAGGDAESMARLNAAREVALQDSARVTHLMAERIEAAIAAAEGARAATERQARAASAARLHLVASRISQLKRLQAGAAALAALAGFVALTNSLLASGLVVGAFRVPTGSTFSAAYMLTTLIFGGLTWYVQSRIRAWEESVSVISATLSDRRSYYEALAAVQEGVEPWERFSRPMLRAAVGRWLSKYPRRTVSVYELLFRDTCDLRIFATVVGADEFADYYIAMGVERAFITEEVKWDDQGLPIDLYRTVRPRAADEATA